jgi:hypothetical protein
MRFYGLLVLLTFSPLSICSLTLKLFIKPPPYQTTSYEFPLNPMQPPSLSTLQNKTILWVKERCSSLHWMTELESQGNVILMIEKSSFKTLKEHYLRINPDAICLPITLYKQIKTLLQTHTPTKPVLAIFYPSTPIEPNWIISLSKSSVEKKIAHLPDRASWIYALAYAHSPDRASETFVLKKLVSQTQKRLTFQKEKKQILKSATAFKMNKEDHLLILGSSLEEIHLAMGSCLKTWSQTDIQLTQLLLSSPDYKQQLGQALLVPCSALWVFLPHTSHRSLIKHLKTCTKLPEHVFLAYYATPWKEEWNFYHYHQDYGTHLHAWRGLIHLKKELNLSSLNTLGSTKAECYLIKYLAASGN